VLKYAIAFALRRSSKIIRGLKEGLIEGERYAVADHAVAQLKERGDPWRLNEDAPTAKPPSTRIRTEGTPPDTPCPRLPSVKPRLPQAGAFSLLCHESGVAQNVRKCRGIGYVYYEDEPGRRAAYKSLT
jgi:hypothetical protein